MIANSAHEGSKAGIRGMVGVCIALAPVLLIGSGRLAAGLGTGLPLMLLSALFGYGYWS